MIACTLPRPRSYLFCNVSCPEVSNSHPLCSCGRKPVQNSRSTCLRRSCPWFFVTKSQSRRLYSLWYTLCRSMFKYLWIIIVWYKKCINTFCGLVFNHKICPLIIWCTIMQVYMVVIVWCLGAIFSIHSFLQLPDPQGGLARAFPPSVISSAHTKRRLLDVLIHKPPTSLPQCRTIFTIFTWFSSSKSSRQTKRQSYTSWSAKLFVRNNYWRK